MESARETALSGATAYLHLAGDVAGGHYLTRAALAEHGKQDRETDRSLALAAFFAEDTLARAPASIARITTASQSLRESGELLWSV